MSARCYGFCTSRDPLHAVCSFGYVARDLRTVGPAIDAANSDPERASRRSQAQGQCRRGAPADRDDTLEKLNSALESLAARFLPAVVQILVTGYGPLREEDRSQTAFIVRQKAVGSGVIVDPSGYIMTNAHVVEGAQRIRVALPLPMGDSAGQVPIGKRRILEARLIGQHKETDLALLKIDETDLPTLPLAQPAAAACRPTRVRHRQP